MAKDMVEPMAKDVRVVFVCVKHMNVFRMSLVQVMILASGLPHDVFQEFMMSKDNDNLNICVSVVIYYTIRTMLQR